MRSRSSSAMLSAMRSCGTRFRLVMVAPSLTLQALPLGLRTPPRGSPARCPQRKFHRGRSAPERFSVEFPVVGCGGRGRRGAALRCEVSARSPAGFAAAGGFLLVTVDDTERRRSVPPTQDLLSGVDALVRLLVL